jgi:hypothetical protein
MQGQPEGVFFDRISSYQLTEQGDRAFGVQAIAEN